MAGNEIQVAEFLFENIHVIQLAHLGLIEKISAPTKSGIVEIKSKNDLLYISTENSAKKADIYVNDRGVSIKQTGATFSFNRLQRADILDVLTTLGLNYSNNILSSLDRAVDDFHNLRVKGRSRPWNEIFEEPDFYKLLKFLMMEGSPHYGLSAHPAEFILRAPAIDINVHNVEISTFDEYYDRSKNNFKIAIRRQWIGQSSDSEHRRATGLAIKDENKQWVYDNVVGSPRRSRSTGMIWRNEVESSNRRTVYLIFIENS